MPTVRALLLLRGPHPQTVPMKVVLADRHQVDPNFHANRADHLVKVIWGQSMVQSSKLLALLEDTHPHCVWRRNNMQLDWWHDHFWLWSWAATATHFSNVTVTSEALAGTVANCRCASTEVDDYGDTREGYADDAHSNSEANLIHTVCFALVVAVGIFLATVILISTLLEVGLALTGATHRIQFGSGIQRLIAAFGLTQPGCAGRVIRNLQHEFLITVLEEGDVEMSKLVIIDIPCLVLHCEVHVCLVGNECA